MFQTTNQIGCKILFSLNMTWFHDFFMARIKNSGPTTFEVPVKSHAALPSETEPLKASSGSSKPCS